MVEAEGGKCKGYVVDISKKEEVYKAAEVVRKEVGDVSLFSLFPFLGDCEWLRLMILASDNIVNFHFIYIFYKIYFGRLIDGYIFVYNFRRTFEECRAENR